MDNFHVTVTSEGRDHFERALSLFFDHAPGSKAIGYQVTVEKGLILYWTKPDGVDEFQEFPYEMNLADAVNFAWGWIEKTPYPKRPDHDGDNGKGFVIYNEDWGHVNHEWEAFVAIAPVWAMYGK
jgi:hypothetical protein